MKAYTFMPPTFQATTFIATPAGRPTIGKTLNQTLPWQCLYFLPLPQKGMTRFLPIF